MLEGIFVVRRLVLCGALVALVVSAPASAELKAGTSAPPFEARASIGGKVFDFNLRAALEKGPVVLYFYPAAFTSGCTLEAHDFASHVGDYKKLGATVIGVSGDDIATLNRFSVSACRSKFAVASDADHKISHAYDATLGLGAATFSDRTSYVIAKEGTIAYSYRSLDASRHVANTLAALGKLKR